MKKKAIEKEIPVVNYIKDDMKDDLREEYEDSFFDTAKKNPFAGKIKKQITIRIDQPTIDYFKIQAEELGIPYQTLINMYLSDCARNKRKLTLSWG
jgi:predicted DNA binding CopG/RHH family protein